MEKKEDLCKNFTAMMLKRMLNDAEYMNLLKLRNHSLYMCDIDFKRMDTESWKKIESVFGESQFFPGNDDDDDDVMGYHKLEYSSRDLYFFAIQDGWNENISLFSEIRGMQELSVKEGLSRISKLAEDSGILGNKLLYKYVVDYIYEKDPVILRGIWFPRAANNLVQTDLFKPGEWSEVSRKGFRTFFKFSDVVSCVKQYKQSLPLFRLNSISDLNKKTSEYLSDGFVYRKDIHVNSLLEKEFTGYKIEKFGVKNTLVPNELSFSSKKLIVKFVENLNLKTEDNKFYCIGYGSIGSINPVSEKDLERMRKDFNHAAMQLNALPKNKNKEHFLLRDEENHGILTKFKNLFQKKSCNFDFYKKELIGLGKDLSKEFVTILDSKMFRSNGTVEGLRNSLSVEEFKVINKVITEIKKIQVHDYAENANFSVKQYLNLFMLYEVFGLYNQDSVYNSQDYIHNNLSHEEFNADSGWKNILMGKYIHYVIKGSANYNLDKIYNTFLKKGCLIDFLKIRDEFIQNFKKEEPSLALYDCRNGTYENNKSFLDELSNTLTLVLTDRDLQRLSKECGHILPDGFLDFKKAEKPNVAILEVNLHKWDCFKEQDYAFTNANIVSTVNLLKHSLQQSLLSYCDIDSKYENPLIVNNFVEGHVIKIPGELSFVVNNNVQDCQLLVDTIKSVGTKYFQDVITESSNPQKIMTLKHGLVDEYQSLLNFKNLDLEMNKVKNNQYGGESLIVSAEYEVQSAEMVQIIDNNDGFESDDKFKL